MIVRGAEDWNLNLGEMIYKRKQGSPVLDFLLSRQS